MSETLIWLLLSIAAGATLALVAYVQVWLPRRAEKRLRAMVCAFSTAVQLRFPMQRAHAERTVALALRVGRRMGLGRERLFELELAARLRDIGLCSIPYRFNQQPMSHWTLSETRTFLAHSEVSGAMLDLIPSLRNQARIIRLHHGCYRAAPAESRILRVVAEYVWNERRFGTRSAQERLREQSGLLYCPDAVRSLELVLNSTGAGELQASVAV